MKGPGLFILVDAIYIFINAVKTFSSNIYFNNYQDLELLLDIILSKLTGISDKD